MDIVAKELARIARLLIGYKVDLKSRYDYWNRIVFEGKLPNIPINWARSKIWAGNARGLYNRLTRKVTPISIQISDFLADPKFIDATILHEMIHIEQFVDGRKGGHGYDFDIARIKYSKKSGIEINRTESLDNLVIPEDLEIKPKGIILLNFGNGKYGMSVFKIGLFQSSLSEVKKMAISQLEYFARRNQIVTSKLIICKVKELMKYRDARTLKSGWYDISDSLAKEILAGQVLEELSLENKKVA